MGTLKTSQSRAACGRCESARVKSGRGFTLIELLTVMAIMVIMLGMAVWAFRGLGSGTGMRGAVLSFKSAMSLARQNAVTHRLRNRLDYGNGPDGRAFYTISEQDRATSAWILQGMPTLLPQGVRFDLPPLAADSVEFKIDGSCANEANNKNISLMDDESDVKVKAALQVHVRTGRIKVMMGQP